MLSFDLFVLLLQGTRHVSVLSLFFVCSTYRTIYNSRKGFSILLRYMHTPWTVVHTFTLHYIHTGRTKSSTV